MWGLRERATFWFGLRNPDLSKIEHIFNNSWFQQKVVRAKFVSLFTKVLQR